MSTTTGETKCYDEKSSCVPAGENQLQQQQYKSSSESKSSSNENNINNNDIDTHRGKFVTAKLKKILINF